KEVVEPALAQGKIVITTRYVESSLAYQSAQGLSIEWIKVINQNIIWPNITIILDIAPDNALSRIKRRGKLEEFEKVEFLRRVRKNFLERAKEKGYLIVDSNQPINATQKLVREHLESFLRNARK
ncbi:MAG: dTMP kinase, partial [Promethearchaeota archaeon]